jgi:riboflavin biosynthesis pyrimidine reductase
MKAPAEKDIAVSGPTLASTYLAAGLNDEIAMDLVPVMVGSGTPLFQTKDQLKLALLEERKFANGEVFVRYRVCH